MKKHLFVISLVLIILLISTYYVLGSDLFFVNTNKKIIKPQVAGLKIKHNDNNIKVYTKEQFLETKIKRLTDDVSGQYSFSIKLLSENVEKRQREKEDDSEHGSFEINVNSKNTYYPASLYKVPLAISVVYNISEERFKLTDKVEYKKEHKREGSGVLKDGGFGKSYTTEELLSYLLKFSDNTAQEMLGGKENLKLIYEMLPSDKGVTSKQIVDIFEDLYSNKYFDDKYSDFIFDLMSNTAFDNRISSGLSDNIKFAHKIGNWSNSGTWHDCGVIFGKKDVAVCILSKNTTFEQFLDVSENFGHLVENYFDL